MEDVGWRKMDKTKSLEGTNSTARTAGDVDEYMTLPGPMHNNLSRLDAC